MSKLNQYIGGIVSSITNARSLSDLQAVELAKQYAQHDLLKHFSVPRMRIDDIEMTIPVAMSAPSTGNVDTFDRSRLNNAVIDVAVNFIGLKTLPKEISNDVHTTIAEITKSDLRSQIKADSKISDQASIQQPSQSKITPDISQDIMTGAEVPFKGSDVQAVQSVQPAHSNESIRAYSERMAKYFLEIENKINPESTIVSGPTIYREQTLASQIRGVVTSTLASDTVLLGDTNVIIEASQLRDIPRENIIYMKIKLREDAMEWAISEDKNGKVQSKLLPA